MWFTTFWSELVISEKIVLFQEINADIGKNRGLGSTHCVLFEGPSAKVCLCQNYVHSISVGDLWKEGGQITPPPLQPPSVLRRLNLPSINRVKLQQLQKFQSLQEFIGTDWEKCWCHQNLLWKTHAKYQDFSITCSKDRVCVCWKKLVVDGQNKWFSFGNIFEKQMREKMFRRHYISSTFYFGSFEKNFLVPIIQIFGC